MNKKYINVIKKERFTKDNIKVKKKVFLMPIYSYNILNQDNS